MAKEQRNIATRPLVTVAAFVVVVAGMKAAQPILVPFLLSLFIAVIATPAMIALRNRGLPTPAALLGVVAIVGLLGGGFASIVVRAVGSFTGEVEGYRAQLKERLEPWQSSYREWKLELQEDPNWFDEALLSVLPGTQRAGEAASAFDFHAMGDSALRTLTVTVNGLAGALTNAFFIFLTVVFLLLEASSFRTKMRAAFGNRTEMLDKVSQIAQDVNRYMSIKTWISLATGAGVALFLSILGVDFAVLWGLFAFLLNFIPNVGSILAAVPPSLLAFVQFGPGRAAVVVGGFLVVNVLIGNFLEPRFMGKGLGLSTLVVFLSLVFWGWVLGPVGMLLSVPLSMAIKIALESSRDMRWLAILLSSESAAKASMREG